VLGTTQNPSTRTLAKGLLCAGMLAMALLLTLAAAGASAAVSTDEPDALLTAVSGSTPELTPESTTPTPASEAPSTGVPTPTPVVEVTLPTPTPVVEVTQPPSTPVVEVTPPPSTPVVEVTPPIPTPVVEVTPPPATPVLPAPEASPPAQAKAPAPPVTEPVEVTPTPTPVAEAPAASADPIAATGAEAALSVAAPSSGQIADGLTSPPAGPPQQNTGALDGAPVEASSVLLGRLAVGGRSAPPPSGPAAAAVGAVALTPAQRAAELSCELSGMVGTSTHNCRAELGGQIPLSAPAAGFRAPTGSRTGPPNDDGYGNSIGGSHPVIPAPAPAPGGAVGGSAAGGSGVALSGSFTLAGLLLHAAPRALRRLRLSCQPWRTAFFVLIPERPG
jgi:hypothetical protein